MLLTVDASSVQSQHIVFQVSHEHRAVSTFVLQVHESDCNNCNNSIATSATMPAISAYCITSSKNSVQSPHIVLQVPKTDAVST
jgi:hypothetical protein